MWDHEQDYSSEELELDGRNPNIDGLKSDSNRV